MTCETTCISFGKRSEVDFEGRNVHHILEWLLCATMVVQHNGTLAGNMRVHCNVYKMTSLISCSKGLEV